MGLFRFPVFGEFKMPELINSTTLARIIGVDVQTIRKMTKQGKIPCIRVSPQTIRYSLDDVLTTLKSP